MFNIGPQEVFIALLIFLMVLLPGIFFALTLFRTLSRCAPASRTMEPGLIWLIFVPAFGLIWNFFVVSAMTKSLRNEFQTRGAGTVDTGHNLGMIYCVSMCLCLVPLLNIVTWIPALIAWILYWVKIAGLSSRLATTGPSVPATSVGSA